MSPPPTRARQSSESEPSNVNKRARITRHACERCRSGKKKCDGQLSPMMFPSIASSSESYERQSRYNSSSRQRTTENDGSANDMSMVTAVGPEVASEVPEPNRDRDDGREDRQDREVHNHNREHTLARIAHVMANGTVSRYPSPGVTILSPADGRPIVSSETDISTKGDLLDRLHRHLTVVFSLRSFPKGHLGEELKDENDNKRGADELFFLPSSTSGCSAATGDLIHIPAPITNGTNPSRSAWLAFGTAARMSQLLRLHRKSPDGTPQELDEPRRQAFWSGYMMDRYLSLVLGCPVIYDERDITQRFPSYPNSGDNSVDTQDEGQRLAGSIAHIKLSQILGHALRKLQSPGELSDLERSVAVQSLNHELNHWLAETPRFFHPDGPDACDLGPFASIPPFFQRQPLAPLTVMSPEVTTCVESAISIAKSVSKMRDSPGAKGTFWNSAYFCFASLTVLLVYLMVYEDAPRRAEIESMIEAAMEGHIQLTGSTKREREQILEESKRISELLRRRQEEPEMSGSRTQYIPPPWPGMEDPFVGR
ncbi:hypothetical protein I309_05378 [Cryptococcus deuterogattii LA55]|nr:hypothetical protein I309_05378 [Cryptococcus deuterogattii LA55]KIR89994.1 hypothetical protein I304_06248 [Cryptococcus deuterogattii CBS 10090]